VSCQCQGLLELFVYTYDGSISFCSVLGGLLLHVSNKRALHCVPKNMWLHFIQ